jgi:predicted site-specific integrase-resolvase
MSDSRHMTETRFLNTKEAADALGVVRQTVIRWVDEERLHPFQKLSGETGAYIFELDEVERVKAELAKAATA